MTLAFTDAEGLLRTWLASLSDLVGAGQPLEAGAHLTRLRSPYTQCWALLSAVGGDDQWFADAGSHRARISASVYGPTRRAAANAAVAYANALRRIPAAKPSVAGVRLDSVDNIAGPIYIPDGEDHRYLLDADLYLIPL